METINQKIVSLDDVNIHYKEKNSTCARTILCLHALGHSLKDYDQIFENDNFSDYRIVAIDFPGHGDSSPGKEAASSSYYTEITEKFIKQLDLKYITVLGNSTGGAVAIRLASQKEKNHIDSIQLANPAGLDKRGILSKPFLEFMIWFFRKGASKHPRFEKWFSYYYSKVLPSVDATKRKNEIIRDAYKMVPTLVEGWSSFKLSSEDLREVAGPLTCPVLVTWAMKDKKVQYKRNIKAIGTIQQLKLIKYNIGHTPILENSREFLKDLKSFFTNQQQQSHAC